MKPCAVIDLHCDTLTDYMPSRAPDTMDDAAKALSLSALPEGVHWAQCFAVFIPDELRGKDAVAYYDRWRGEFVRQTAKFADRVLSCRGAADIERAWAAGKTAALLTVENGSALSGDLERVETLKHDGVCAVTLTWNGANELGSGHETDGGLTPFGVQAVRELERCGILVDASHLNDAGFAALLGVAEKPFVATHSNARAVCTHKRNLTDGMIREMVRRGCLIGLNYYTDFLRDDGAPCTLDDLWRHIEHFLELGAQHCLALGSDFDGAETPECLSSPARVVEMYDALLMRGLSRETLDGIFYRNALEFFKKNLP
ncbi:MAG: membrane dipeptidase [Kiritimatiellae bacterium]|nr:membrane dipeptidase [Kiritimatiellia bacterium]